LTFDALHQLASGLLGAAIDRAEIEGDQGGLGHVRFPQLAQAAHQTMGGPFHLAQPRNPRRPFEEGNPFTQPATRNAKLVNVTARQRAISLAGHRRGDSHPIGEPIPPVTIELPAKLWQ
jgi:hypothetical protein